MSRRRYAVLLGKVAAKVASRGAEALLVAWLLASLVFLAMRLLPGDPAILVLGEQAGEAERALFRERLGLNRPLFLQYLSFAQGLLTLNLGDSLTRPGVSAFDVVAEALSPTAALAGLAVGLGAVLGIGGAVLSVGPWLGERRLWVHRGAVVLAALPLIAIAPIATWALAVKARAVPLPGDPDAGLFGLVFASSLLALPLGAILARIGRAALIDLGRAQFLDVAAAKGARPARIWWIHALPVVSAPIAAVLATQLGALLGGAVVLERLFERPGLGTVMLEAYASRDLPVLEASVVASGLLFVIAQTSATAIVAFIDPRGEEP